MRSNTQSRVVLQVEQSGDFGVEGLGFEFCFEVVDADEIGLKGVYFKQLGCGVGLGARFCCCSVYLKSEAGTVAGGILYFVAELPGLSPLNADAPLFGSGGVKGQGFQGIEETFLDDFALLATQGAVDVTVEVAGLCEYEAV